jgi:hypothetical protein
MSYAPPKPPAESKGLGTILIVVAIVAVCCVGVPLIGGLGAAAFLGIKAADREQQVLRDSIQIPSPAMPGPAMPEMPSMPTMPEFPPTEFPPTTEFTPGGGIPGANKIALQQQMLIAEQQYRFAQANYDAAQASYETQRNFALQQAGRLGAQGGSVPQPQPPDPALAQQVEAARIQYENAKAAYEAAP